MAKPKFLGIRYARLAKPVKEGWETEVKSAEPDAWKAALARLKSLRTCEARIASNALTAGDTLQHSHWPACVAKDYGAVPNLFRFELADRWRGHYALIGEPGGARAVILYLWDHATYDKMHGYAKK